ncbi:MAG: hypothetical protein A3E81_01530 [Gammaproteobacteria bacterium RIFCSPHIGHO2_12_FULL_36_30]|nr:MAG: hypothetical protein A3E81_01530 [Gammaproteobacteria bacterium RIFCSPHIGHO2_12_FULL_36_30]
MKKVLITGGSGTVGRAFINTFYDRYSFISYDRNKEKQATLQATFPAVKLITGSIENKEELINTFSTIRPDIVIHAAALKYIDIAEKQPSLAIKINVLGSMNIIDAARIVNVPITIGISSDKACLSNSIYGHTKNLMEHLFLEANDEKNKFIICRFCNVAGSYGSVISRWLDLKSENKTLKITDPKMNRFMFLPKDAANLIQKAIEQSENHLDTGIVIKKVKAVNMFDLASCISNNIEIIGKRAGERLNETLISVDEIPFTKIQNEYVLIQREKNTMNDSLDKELNSFDAERMSIGEMNNLLKNIECAHEKCIN